MKYNTKEVKQNALPANIKDQAMMTQGTHLFLNDLQLMLKDKKVETAISTPAPYSKFQCMYTLSFKDKEVLNIGGVEEMLGYSEQEFNYGSMMRAIHPADSDALLRVMDAVAEYAGSAWTGPEVVLSITYRIRKKNGNYIKVLCQTTISNHSVDKQMVSQLTDISFMKSGNYVEWTFDAPNLDQEKFRMYVQQSYQQFFSSRELEVLELIDKGLTSNAIAEKLFLSKHTVDTHRRKMLQKSGCANAIELLEFYRLNVL